MPRKTLRPASLSPSTEPAGASTTGPAAATASPGTKAEMRSAKRWKRRIFIAPSEAIVGADADRARPHPGIAAVEKRLGMDIGDRLVVEQILDIGRDRKSTRLNSSH